MSTNFRPAGIAPETGRLYGIFIPKDRNNSILEVNLALKLAHPEHALPLDNARFPYPSQIMIIDFDDAALTFAIHAMVRPDAEIPKYWIWNVEQGFQAAPDCFQSGGNLRSISSNGRFLSGTNANHQAVIYDLVTGSEQIIDCYKHCTCTWISPDGRLALGHTGKGWGWVLSPEYPETKLLQEIVLPDVPGNRETHFTKPLQFSSNGNYLHGTREDSSGIKKAWVAESSLLGIDVSEFFEDSSQHHAISTDALQTDQSSRINNALKVPDR